MKHKLLSCGGFLLSFIIIGNFVYWIVKQRSAGREKVRM